jgi:hypothetical protein
VKFLGGAVILFCAGALLVWVVSPHKAAYPDAAPAAKTYDSGVLGVVELTPACPVAQTGSASCARAPYEARVTVTQEGYGSAYTSIVTASDGAFHFALPPGAYVISASGADASVSCAPVRVAVTSAGFTNADITCATVTS